MCPADPIASLYIPVAVSARHVHLTARSLVALFGPGHALHIHATLHQPGQFAAEEAVTLVGPKGSLPHVRVVGPAREEDQVEISRTDELALGLDAPVRLSGELAHTPGIELVGPAGRIRLDHGVVLAQRHVHMSPAEADRLGLRDHEIVQVALGSAERALIFNDVIVRVSPHYQLELHLDTDEGNAAGVRTGDQARLLRRGTAAMTVAEETVPSSTARAPDAALHQLRAGGAKLFVRRSQERSIP
jgi:propanediol utilization protein